MQTDYLKYLLDIAELGSISAAAERSFITPQGVRRAIGVLEGEVGYPLLVREGRSTNLTAYGQAMLKDAKAILDTQNHMQQAIAKIGAAPAPALRYSIEGFFHPAVFDTSFFSPLVNAQSKVLRTMRIHGCSNDEVVSRMTESSDELDGVVRVGMLALFSMHHDANAELISTLAKRGFMVYPYLTYHDEILVSERSSLAKRPFVTIDDVRDKPFAVVNEDLRSLVEEMIAPTFCTLTPDSGFRDRLVENNEAVSVVPSITRLNPISPTMVQVPLSDGWDVTLAFVGRSNLLSNKSIKQVLNVLNSCYVRNDEEMDEYYTVHFAG